MNVDRELLEYEAAGALAEELPYWGWLEDGRSCLTRSGELVSVGRLSPVVLDGHTPDQLDRVLDRWQRMLSGVDSRTRLYFYLFRRPTRFEDADGPQGVAALSRRKRRAFLAERVRDVEIYLAWSYDPRLGAVAKGRGGKPWWVSHACNWMARRRRAHESVYLYSNIQAAAERFRQLVDSSRALVNDLTPIQLLDADAGSLVLSELINRPGTPWDGATGSGMNWRLAVSELEAERRYLRLDGEPVILYSLLSPPAGARANLLNDLYCLDARMTIAIEWRPWGLDSARRKIRSAQRHYFSKRYSMAAHMQETEGTTAAMADTAAAAESDRLGDALVELETEGIAYGDLSLSIALHGELDKTERLDGDLRRIFAAHDAKAIREGYGQLANWFSRLPAQPRKRQVCSVFMSAGAAACLAPIFGPPRGSPRSRHLDRDSLAVLETRWKTPYYYDLFHGDVGHTLVLGATGAGKSFTLNFLLVEALQYDPRVLILDLGGSYRWLTSFLGGGYMELSPGNGTGDGGAAGGGFRLRPFSLPAGERTYQFLTGWLTRLLRIGGWQAGGEDPSEIRARVEDLYAFPPGRRTLGVLVRSLPSKMWSALDRWHGEGAWGRYFDNPAGADNLELEDWQVIDLAGAAEHEDLCEAALHAAGAGAVSTWKQLIAKPAGSMPGGGLTQRAVGLGTLLMAALFMFWPYFGGGGEVETPTAGQGRQPAGPDMQDQVSGQVQEESLRQQQLDDARDRLDRQQRDASNVAGGRITALDLFDPPAPGDGAGPGRPATEAELELREALRLEEIERWRRSIRSPPLAQSYRASRPAALSPTAEPPTNPAAPTASKPGPGIHAAADQMNQTLASVQQSLAGLQAEVAAAGQPLPASAPAAPPTTAAANNDYHAPVKVSQPSDPPGWERIYEGSFLEAVLVTQLSGDFPGPVLAMVSVPFYSPDRQRVLVPRGARVLGTASAVANQDQTRLAVGFHRLLFPDSRWVSLEFQGLNQVGEGALKDRVNRHYLSMFTAVGAIGVLSGLTLQGSNPYAGGAAGFRAGAGQGLAQSATQILQRFLNRLPTITIRAGHRLCVWFTSDVLVPRPQGA